MTWFLHRRSWLGQPGVCVECGHAAYVHPCGGWSRKWNIRFGRIVVLIRCRCKEYR